MRASTICSGSPARSASSRISSMISHCSSSVSGAQIATLRPSRAHASTAGSPTRRAMSTASAVSARRRAMLASPSIPSGPAARRASRRARSALSSEGRVSDGLLEQRQQVRVASPLRPHPAAAVSERGTTQALGQPGAASHLRGAQERSPGAGIVAGARLERRRDRAADRRARRRRHLRCARPVVSASAIEPRGLLVGEPRRRQLGSLRRVSTRPLVVRRLVEVVGELRPGAARDRRHGGARALRRPARCSSRRCGTGSPRRCASRTSACEKTQHTRGARSRGHEARRDRDVDPFDASSPASARATAGSNSRPSTEATVSAGARLGEWCQPAVDRIAHARSARRPRCPCSRAGPRRRAAARSRR